MNPTAPSLNRLAERFAVLRDQYGYTPLDAAGFDAFIAAPGACVVMFADDPQKVPETWDLTIILPEALKGMEAAPRVGLLPPEAAKPLAARYGITLWPSLLVLRDGAYLGAIEGLKDWNVYSSRIPELLAAAASRPPSIGIPVRTVGTGGNPSACH